MTLLRKILMVAVSILIPFFILMTSIRLLLLPVFTELEYRRPGFPADPYGFTLQDRLKWSRISVDYLTNSAGLDFLADQKLDATIPLYNERELSHMLDVKNLVQFMLIAWPLTGIAILGIGLLAFRFGWPREYWLTVSRGGWAAVWFIIALLAGVAVSFNALFTGFHRIFFSGDTWLFLYTDTLIRLFPMDFWRDAFIVMGVFMLAGGLAVGFLGRSQANKN